MLVKQATVNEKSLEETKTQFNLDTFKVLNYRGNVVWQTDELSDNTLTASADEQVMAGRVEAKGNMSVPSNSDAGIVQVSVGQGSGPSWSLTMVADNRDSSSSRTSYDIDCKFMLPPTSAFLLSRFIPVPVKSVCPVNGDVPEEIEQYI